MSENCIKNCMIDKCRICLSNSNSMIDMFRPEIFIKIKEFAASISTVIDNDNDLPKNICHICLYKLDMWDDFKQQLINSNQFLLNLSDSHELSILEKNSVNNINNLTNDNDLMQLANESSQINSQPLKALNSEVASNKTNLNMLQSQFSLKTSKNETENSSEGKQTTELLIKTRYSGIRRTNEQRMASTQRWVARKRALLAATGENDSDTDSINSDATLKLSSLKKHRKSFNFSTNENHQFEPQSMQSELVMGDAMFIITSSLFLSELSNVNQLSNVLKLPSNHEGNNIVTHKQQNIDIMNALQLCRIESSNKYLMEDGKFVERCLNIEIEGTEFEKLQNLQFKLASFIDKDLKKKLINEKDCSEDMDSENIKCREPFQTLEQQLKVIVEKSVKKNLNKYQVMQCKTINKFHHKKTFSTAFIKAAMKSKVFQPRVFLDRLDLNLINIENDRNSHKLPKHLTNLNCYKNQVHNVDERNNYCNGNDIKILKKLKEKKESIDVNNDGLNDKRHVCRAHSGSFDRQLDVHRNFSIHKEQVLSEKIVKKIMRCKECDESVEADLVETHICKSLLSKYHHKCNKCDIIFCTDSLLLNHKKIHEKDQKISKVFTTDLEKLYSCFICNKKFTDDEILKKHLQNYCDDANKEHGNMSTSMKMFQCAICGHTLSTEDKLEAHVEQHLLDDADNNSNLVNIIQANSIKESPGIQSDVKRSYLHSNNKFDTNVELALNIQTHDTKDKIIESLQDDFQMQNESRMCTICDLNFNNEQELLDHLNVHNNASCVCMLCDQPFLTLVELQKHVNSH
ncbi:GSCOCG00010796001-RA-CDS [Cotesia congregata]|uniref:Similar to ZNF808: Zinc finger protein 808 (Homo sapiens) n=1 Tax=Cotesia congregata TaxID=51543 RepID=A0A8J2E8Q1_COTCN|nr:GSCOCG00010796001-RA-CDS [Cotesia congregata]CAG5073454.1 Similar to ZNF808: Zinc finger protein 808 (Homo sapiens) [Cotesia congregata]